MKKSTAVSILVENVPLCLERKERVSGEMQCPRITDIFGKKQENINYSVVL